MTKFTKMIGLALIGLAIALAAGVFAAAHHNRPGDWGVMLFAQIGIDGVRRLAATPWEEFEAAILRAAADLGYVIPDRLAVRSWWEQGQVLVEA